jgi:hypothetical protein
LKDAYYRADSFPPETATTLRIQVLSALGTIGNPAATKLLVTVLQEPEVKGADADRQQSLDVRIAAARALGHFPSKESVETLVAVLKSDQEPLHVPAYESLVAATNRHLPPDPQVWADVLQKADKDGTPLVVEPSLTDKVLDILPVSFWK